MFNAGLAQKASRERRAYVAMSADGNSLFGYTGVLARRTWEELRPSRLGLIFIAYDLGPSQAEARAQILALSLYRAALVGALALIFWCIVHFVLTRPTARLVAAAERIAAGDGSARSGLAGDDELGRLGRAFDAMAQRVEASPLRLLQELAARERERTGPWRCPRPATGPSSRRPRTRSSSTTSRPVRFVDANPRACRAFGYSSDELRRLDVGALSSGEPPYTQADAMAVIARAPPESH